MTVHNGQLHIGWGHGDMTPPDPVLLRGQFHARVSEGILDPVTTTVLIIATRDGESLTEHAVFVSCDLVSASEDLHRAVRDGVRRQLPQIDPSKVLISATHTHTAPGTQADPAWSHVGLDFDVLGVMSPGDYVSFCSDRIVKAISEAWKNLEPAGISWGVGDAVVGHNRLWTNKKGKSTMYGNTHTPDFSHIEGYEDHSVGLLYTWNEDRVLTGVVTTVPCPAQVSEREFKISADYWHETRSELKRRLGKHVFVLAQCAPAGDQSPHRLIRKSAEERMLRLKNQTRREEIAGKIADAVERLFPVMKQNVEWRSPFRHVTETVYLPRRALREEDVEHARAEANIQRPKYETMRDQLMRDPALRSKPRWYTDVTRAYALMRRHERVIERVKLAKTNPTHPAEVHVIRLGGLAIATNPFEFYLDYGIQIQTRSPAVQTNMVQLTGPATGNGYIPTDRSIAHGGYGAVPASTIVGPEGGRQLVERTLDILRELWE